MKADAASGQRHPMELKKALGRKIVQDFHGEQAAVEAEQNWTRQFQKDQVPENIETQTVAIASIAAEGNGNKAVRADKLIVLAGMADSATDAQRKRKQKAVKIDDKLLEDHVVVLDSMECVLKVGRKIKRIR